MQLGALAYADSLDIVLSSQSILAQAQRETGLDDFGPTGFIQHLLLWRACRVRVPHTCST